MLSCCVLCWNSVVGYFNCGACLQVLLGSGNAAGVLQTLLQAASAKLEQLNKPKPSSHSTCLPRSGQALQRHFAEQRDRYPTSPHPTLVLPHPYPQPCVIKPYQPIHMQSVYASADVLTHASLLVLLPLSAGVSSGLQPLHLVYTPVLALCRFPIVPLRLPPFPCPFIRGGQQGCRLVM